MQRVEVPVLIVGAGTVGLTAAILLARQGIESLVVDRRPGPHRAPQAHVANPRTLEIFRSAGLDRETLRRLATPRDDGSHVSWVTTLAGPELGRLPYERQGDDALEYTPTPLLNLSQHRLEPLLLEHLRGATVRASGHGSLWLAPLAKAFTIGAQPAAWTATSFGSCRLVQPSSRSSSSAL